MVYQNRPEFDNSADARWQAVLSRDVTADGKFVFGVTTTGIYCRPSCPARRPKRDHVQFFDSPQQAERAGLRACFRCKPAGVPNGPSLVERICRHIEAHADEKLTLAKLSQAAGLSPFHLQRVFKSEMGISPRQYLESLRFAKFKQGLRTSRQQAQTRKLPAGNGAVTDALIDAGYSSPSRLYETAHKKLGMTPRRFLAGAPEEELRFTTFQSELGEMLLVASNAGLCGVQFLTGQSAEVSLKSEYSRASFTRDDAGLKGWTLLVKELLAGRQPSKSISLDIRGTAFQQRVWQVLQRIPAGKTRTYAEVACAIGKPQAVRAVANACASNRLAVVVPCHRVVRSNGELSGYRWGTDRKRRLLENEEAGSQAAASRADAAAE
jgi:AraC family transcriptional regulator of adaptative response/methylated-DNA-[protein]-cysteine methyltransferase